MTDRILVATRKGLFALSRRGRSDWSVSATAFLGDPVSAVLWDRRDDTIYAALNLGHFGHKMHRSGDGGKTWQALAAPAFAAAPTDGDAAPEGGNKAGPSVSLIWTLAAGGADQSGRLWAGTIPGGLFRSDDSGESWHLTDSLWQRPERAEWFGGGYDDPGIHSICIDPRDSNRISVGVSCGGVWKSGDDGESWRLAGKGQRADYVPPPRDTDPLYQDPHRLAVCAATPDTVWCQHHNGIFRSEDAAETFTEIDGVAPSAFGFAVAAHPQDPATAWFAPARKDDCRIPVDGRLVVTRTRDGGRSFQPLTAGLPTSPAYDLVYRHALDVDDSGDRLVMGSTTGNLWISEDGGDRWTYRGHLPPIAQTAFA